MADSIGEKIAGYRPSKTVWFWTTAGAVVVTIIAGFASGAWVTSGAATQRAETAAEDAVAQLASTICAHRFLEAADAGQKLAALKEESSWQRDTFLEEQGWVTFAGADKPIAGAGEGCAEILMEAELPAVAVPVAETPVAEATPS